MMRRVSRVLMILLMVMPLSALGAGKGGGKGRSRGNKAGTYKLTVTGHFSGNGTATVTGTTLSLTAPVKVSGGGSGDLVANDLVIDKGYFKGTGTVMGVTCTIEGRIDLPDAQDAEQDDKQATTGRITGTFKDANGNVGRIVAVQQTAADAGANVSRR
jgi:hypothetical protein